MLRQLMRQARKRVDAGGSVIFCFCGYIFELSLTVRTFFAAFTKSSGTSQAFRTAAAREIKHFVDELT